MRDPAREVGGRVREAPGDHAPRVEPRDRRPDVAVGAVPTVLAMASSMAAGLQGSALGLFMVVSAAPWYAVYGSGQAALDDQRLAGALMWGATGGVYVLAVAFLLWRLLEQAEGAVPHPGKAEV
jgi:hypothetical protein